MKYLFGPVNSRRLGLSLGIDIIPAKVCNYNCIYCEVGATTELTCDRKEYVETGEVLAEIDGFLLHKDTSLAPDVFTIIPFPVNGISVSSHPGIFAYASRRA